MRVSPFRDLRINGYLLLPEAFRSLSRLSSALSAKASTLRSSLLDRFARSFGLACPTFFCRHSFRTTLFVCYFINLIVNVLGCLDI